MRLRNKQLRLLEFTKAKEAAAEEGSVALYQVSLTVRSSNSHFSSSSFCSCFFVARVTFQARIGKYSLFRTCSSNCTAIHALLLPRSAAYILCVLFYAMLFYSEPLFNFSITFERVKFFVTFCFHICNLFYKIL